MTLFASRRAFGALGIHSALVCALPGALSTAWAQPASPLVAPTDAALDAAVAAQMRSRQIAGVAVAVVRNGQPVVARAWGDAKLAGGTSAVAEAAKPDTLFFIDSATKQFTASAIMLLVQEGRMTVDDLVKVHLPGAPKSWDGIRVRHLLSHTAGLPRDVRPYAPMAEQNCKPQAVLSPLFKLTPQSAPGAQFLYSNAGYNALAAVIERVTGDCYFTFLNNRIFGPLGLQRTALAVYATQAQPGHARGYQAGAQGAALQPVALTAPPKTAAAKATAATVLAAQTPHALGGGGIASNVLELAEWESALRGDAILTSETKAQMWTPTTLSSGQISNYGFGWEIEPTAAGRLVHHNGGGFGFNTAIYRYTDTGLSVIVLTNTEAATEGTARPKNNGDAIAQSVAALFDTRLAR